MIQEIPADEKESLFNVQKNYEAHQRERIQLTFLIYFRNMVKAYIIKTVTQM